jgi:hypothetical protein
LFIGTSLYDLLGFVADRKIPKNDRLGVGLVNNLAVARRLAAEREIWVGQEYCIGLPAQKFQGAVLVFDIRWSNRLMERSRQRMAYPDHSTS